MILVKRRIEFRDTDAAGIVHFSAFFPMMEAAEHEALRQVGLSVMQPTAGGGHRTWPRVSAHCDYQHAARFEQVLEIAVSVTRLGQTSVTYGFDFRCEKFQIASGTITAVCCDWSPGGSLSKIPIPDDVRAALQRI